MQKLHEAYGSAIPHLRPSVPRRLGELVMALRPVYPARFRPDHGGPATILLLDPADHTLSWTESTMNDLAFAACKQAMLDLLVTEADEVQTEFGVVEAL